MCFFVYSEVVLHMGDQKRSAVAVSPSVPRAVRPSPAPAVLTERPYRVLTLRSPGAGSRGRKILYSSPGDCVSRACARSRDFFAPAAATVPSRSFQLRLARVFLPIA